MPENYRSTELIHVHEPQSVRARRYERDQPLASDIFNNNFFGLSKQREVGDDTGRESSIIQRIETIRRELGIVVNSIVVGIG